MAVLDPHRRSGVSHALLESVALGHLWMADAPGPDTAIVQRALESMPTGGVIALRTFWALTGEDDGPSMRELLDLPNKDLRHILLALIGLVAEPDELHALRAAMASSVSGDPASQSADEEAEQA